MEKISVPLQCLNQKGHKMSIVQLPDEPTEDMIDAALRSTAMRLTLSGSALTQNREKVRIRYRAMVAEWMKSLPKPESEDEFFGGVWWVPDGAGGVRSASPGECALALRQARAEIKRLTDLPDDAAEASGRCCQT